MKIDNRPQNNVFAVLGVSRSGTSAVARSLKTLGIDLGVKLLAGDARNPKGFWEDAEILYNINRGVSRALNNDWMTVGRFDHKLLTTHPVLQAYKNQAISILQQRFAKTRYWGFKDPRTVTILPFWQAVFAELNLDEHYVIVLRNPLASAYSNQQFINSHLEIGLLVWLMHLFPAIEGTQGKKRVVVSYELMLKDTRSQLERMRSALQLPFPLDEQDAHYYAHEFLDKKLDHFSVQNDVLKDHPVFAIAPLCLEIYTLLLRLARDEIAFDSEVFTQAWDRVKQEFVKVCPAYDFINTLYQENKALEREIRTLRKSLPWKIVYPLRMVDDALRAYRKRMKERKRLALSHE